MASRAASTAGSFPPRARFSTCRSSTPRICALQRLSVECFRGLCDVVAPAWRKDYDSFADYALRHHDIIRRFGRFPHRNADLGRQSTRDEVEFLKQPGSSF